MEVARSAKNQQAERNNCHACDHYPLLPKSLGGYAGWDAQHKGENAVESRKQTHLRVAQFERSLNERNHGREAQARHLQRHHPAQRGHKGDNPPFVRRAIAV
jgi:hypothetical protein